MYSKIVGFSMAVLCFILAWALGVGERMVKCGRCATLGGTVGVARCQQIPLIWISSENCSLSPSAWLWAAVVVPRLRGIMNVFSYDFAIIVFFEDNLFLCRRDRFLIVLNSFGHRLLFLRSHLDDEYPHGNAH